MTEHSIGQVNCQKLAASLLGHGSICDRLLLFNNPSERSRWEIHLPSPSPSSSSSAPSSLSSSHNLSSSENKQSQVKAPQKHPASTLDTNHIRSLLLKRRVALQQARPSSPSLSSPVSRGPLHQLRLEDQPIPLIESIPSQKPLIETHNDEDEDSEDEETVNEDDQEDEGKTVEASDSANQQTSQEVEIKQTKEEDEKTSPLPSETVSNDPKTEEKQQNEGGDDDLLNDLLQNDDETDIQKLIELSQQTQQSLSSSSSSSFSPSLPPPSLSFAQPPPSNPTPSTASDPSDEDLESWLESVI